MHAWILHQEKEGNIFMNINKQTVSRNLNGFKDEGKKATTNVWSLHNYRPLKQGYAYLNSTPNGFVYCYPWTFQNYDKQGWIQKLKKGGEGGNIEWVWCGHAAHAVVFFCMCIMHSVVGGSGGMLPQEIKTI